MEFKAKRRKLRITIDEKTHEVVFPKVSQLERFQEDSLKEKDDLKGVLSFLESLGLPASAARELEPDDLAEVVRLLTGQKKS